VTGESTEEALLGALFDVTNPMKVSVHASESWTARSSSSGQTRGEPDRTVPKPHGRGSGRTGQLLAGWFPRASDAPRKRRATVSGMHLRPLTRRKERLNGTPTGQRRKDDLEGEQSPWKDRAFHCRKRQGMLRTRRRSNALEPVACRRWYGRGSSWKRGLSRGATSGARNRKHGPSLAKVRANRRSRM